MSRNITIKNIHKTPLDERAFHKLIRHYYKGDRNILVNFDNRISNLGEQIYIKETYTHRITFSPQRCSIEQEDLYNIDRTYMRYDGKLVRLNDKDLTARLICILLHEIMHAKQYDRDPKFWETKQSDRHPSISNEFLKYKYSELEAEAEGWALLNLNRALRRYKEWCSE